jgi:hypothetical protein
MNLAVATIAVSGLPERQHFANSLAGLIARLRKLLHSSSSASLINADNLAK